MSLKYEPASEPIQVSFLDNRGAKAYEIGEALAAGGRMYVDRDPKP